MMELNSQEPLNLLDLFVRFRNTFYRMWILVLVMAVVLGGFMYYRTESAFVPMYQSRAIFTVEAGYSDSGDIFGSSAYYDQYAAQQVAGVFPELLNTEMMQDLVMQEMGKNYIPGYADAQAVVNSNMLVLTVQSSNPQDAYDYLTAIIDCYPQVLVFMLQTPQIKIMNSPTVPTKPYNSSNAVSAATKGAILGTILGLMFVFACSLLIHTVQTADELKNTINLPILVALPRVEQKRRRKGNNLLEPDSDPNMEESLRGLRVKVKKLLEQSESHTVLLTSTISGEGKTTIAVNLAQALAWDGLKVAVLDADLRSQNVAKALGEKATGNGLMECLNDKSLSIMDCVRTAKNISFISGRATDDRHYVLSERDLRKILDELNQHFDYVIVDTPPCEVVSDTSTLCRCADVVMYVVKQNYTQKGQVINGVTALIHKDVKIAGFVFNGVPQFHRHYGYGYRSAYGYGYDYGYRKYAYSNNKYSYSGGYRYGYGHYGKYSKYSRYGKYSKYAGHRAKDENHN